MDLNPEQRERWRRFAAEVVRRTLAGQQDLPTAPETLPEAVGAFVALRRGDRPEGFVGRLTPLQDLAATVADVARRAALEDPRFEPGDAAGLEVRLWLSGPSRPVEGPAELAYGSEGVLVREGFHRAVRLPGVGAIGAEEDAEAFLESACIAAQLHPDAWTREEVTVEAFEVIEAA